MKAVCWEKNTTTHMELSAAGPSLVPPQLPSEFFGNSVQRNQEIGPLKMLTLQVSIACNA